MVDEPSVLSVIDDGVATLTLNRPKSINALDHPMVTAMDELLHGWAADPQVSAVVLVGAGERGLCAGGDIVAIHRDASALSSSGAGDAEAAACPSALFWADEYRLNADIARYPKPYVAIMDGIVMGGGVGVSAHANTRVVTDRTRLAMPEVGIGFVPDVGGTHLLARVPDNLGVYAGLTAGQLSGADALELGLADHYVPAGDLDAFRRAIGETSLADALAKYAQEPPESKIAGQREWIAHAFAADSVAAIIDRCRAVGTEDAVKTADTVAAKSPLALAVTLRSLRQTEPTLADTLKREFRVSMRSLLNPDMAEGIRAQVIDKDRNPAWRHTDHTAVTVAEVDAFFAPLPAGLELTINPAPQEDSSV
ncbi:enoyl-CoA hydratase/isomerase family protein [Gordonia sp. (in: high G+C Gram-positive bacteria)]|uniref:enoyl-CoA hydratase/isomerase family protein n=1 Tax=Gordonia sp. (in: high G+C Gram-positive bacteria) TaxID=84139 RepID=UPI00257D1208|nr:enoyl-CoA hydratase/isomerase family protein [Gordonia sp. (in: high G+C Gram-positive bacteria)]